MSAFGKYRLFSSGLGSWRLQSRHFIVDPVKFSTKCPLQRSFHGGYTKILTTSHQDFGIKFPVFLRTTWFERLQMESKGVRLIASYHNGGGSHLRYAQVSKKPIELANTYGEIRTFFTSPNLSNLDNKEEDISIIREDDMDVLQHYLIFQSKFSQRDFFIILLGVFCSIVTIMAFMKDVDSMEDLEDRFKEKNTTPFWLSIMLLGLGAFAYPKLSQNIWRIYYDKKTRSFIFVLREGFMKQTRKIVGKPEDVVTKEIYFFRKVYIKGKPYVLSQAKKEDGEMMKVLLRKIE